MAIKRPNATAAAATAAAQEEAAAPAGTTPSKFKKPAGSGSFASRFDETKPGGGFMAVGQHTVDITGFELEGEFDADGEPKGKVKAKVTYEGTPDEKEGVAGKSLSQWYALADENGEPGNGIGFLKKDLDILGYQEFKFADLEEIFSEITNERPRVIINVKQNGAFTNAYLQGLAAGE